MPAFREQCRSAQTRPTLSGTPAPTLSRPVQRRRFRRQRPGGPARASPSSARRCFRRVSTSFLGSSTFWMDFFTSPWLRRENIAPWEAWAPPAGQEAPAPRESLHRVEAGACRAGHSPLHSRQPLLRLQRWLQEGGADRAPRGEGHEGGVNAEPTVPPRGRGDASRPLRRGARARGPDPSQGRAWSAERAPRITKKLPHVQAVLQVPECTAIDSSNQTDVTLARWESVGRL